MSRTVPSAEHRTRPPRLAIPARETPQFFGRPVHRFTVEEYHKAIDAGAFPQDQPREMLHGWVLDNSFDEKPFRPSRSLDPAKAVPTFYDAPLLRTTVDNYHQMIDAGAIPADARCELLFGWITDTMPPNPPHSKVSYLLMRHLIPLLPAPDYFFGTADAITLSTSEPMPDFYVATGPEQLYDENHPGPDEVLLVIEISDTTLRTDRVAKLAMYAADAIPQYWIIDVKSRRIEIHTQPRRGKLPGYKKREVFSASDDLPIVIGGKKLGAVRVSKLLP